MDVCGGLQRKGLEMNHADKKYKDMTAKQKLRIANKTYEAYRTYYLEHGCMPDDEAAHGIHEKLFQSVLSLAPKTLFEEFEAVCRKRASKYEERIQADIASGVTLESLKEKKRKKTSEEKLEIQKKKNAERRKRRKKKKAETAQLDFNSDQDDNFFFIAGYTSGGAPYGITWEEMGMRPWESLEDEEVEIVDDETGSI